MPTRPVPMYDGASASSTGVEPPPVRPPVPPPRPPPPLPPPAASPPPSSSTVVESPPAGVPTVYTMETIQSFLADHPPPRHQNKKAMNMVLKSLRHLNEDGAGRAINPVVPLTLEPATMRIPVVEHAPKGKDFSINTSTDVEISWRFAVASARHGPTIIGSGITGISLVHRPDRPDTKRGQGRYVWDFKVDRIDGSFCWWHPEWSGHGTVVEGSPHDVYVAPQRGKQFFQRSLAAAYPNKAKLPPAPTPPAPKKHGKA
jgi:hypothetical protein